MVSYYVRSARNYDTLMQMGRWFGFREGYADLTRIYTTEQLEQWFRDLAMVELEVRDDIARYDHEGLTPLEFGGLRIRTHPAMLVTSPLKMQHTRTENLSFTNKLRQTINFPFDNVDWLRRNIQITSGLLSSLGPPTRSWRPGVPTWEGVLPEAPSSSFSRHTRWTNQTRRCAPSQCATTFGARMTRVS